MMSVPMAAGCLYFMSESSDESENSPVVQTCFWLGDPHGVYHYYGLERSSGISLPVTHDPRLLLDCGQWALTTISKPSQLTHYSAFPDLFMKAAQGGT